MKQRLKAANQGYNLLKKKADALTVRFRAILRQIVEVCVIAALGLSIDTICLDKDKDGRGSARRQLLTCRGHLCRR